MTAHAELCLDFLNLSVRVNPELSVHAQIEINPAAALRVENRDCRFKRDPEASSGVKGQR